MAKGEGRELTCPDAVNSITEKDVTKTDRSGNAEALLQLDLPIIIGQLTKPLYKLILNIRSLGHSLAV
jgi:hypothetical protein